MKGLRGNGWIKRALTLMALGVVLGGCAGAKDEVTKEPEQTQESSGQEETTSIAESIEESTESLEESKVSGELSEEAARLFDAVSGWDFRFESGAGAWDTSLTIDGTGSFTGQYHDSNMGDVGEGYENGTLLLSNFTGRFTEVRKITDYVYEAKVTDLTYEVEPDTEEIENGQRVVYSVAYGLEQADVVKIYLPGAKMAELPREYVEWVEPFFFGIYVYGTYYRDYPEELPFCGIYDPKGENGFFAENVSGRNSVYVVNETSFPGLINVRNDLNADGTYFYRDAEASGAYDVTNLCYYAPEKLLMNGRPEEFVKDVISHFMEGREYSGMVFLGPEDSDSFPQVCFLHGDFTYIAAWNGTENGITRSYFARMMQKGAYAYAYGYSATEADQFLQGEAGSYLVGSLTYSGDPNRLSTASDDKVVRKMLAGIINNGSDAQNIMADECLWVSSDDEELMAKYHLTADDMPNDYAIVGMDGAYASLRLTDHCPVYVLYPTEGVFWELRTKTDFHKKMTDSNEPFLMELYLDENDNVTFIYEPYRP